MYKRRSDDFETFPNRERNKIKNKENVDLNNKKHFEKLNIPNNSKISEKEETKILLLNEILQRLTSLESIIMSNTSSVKNENSNRKIVVQRDEQGKIIGAEIVEV